VTQWVDGVVLVVVGVLLALGRRVVTPVHSGGLGAAGETRAKVERSWMMMGAICVVVGVFVLIKNA
jgi:hypothetical protein